MTVDHEAIFTRLGVVEGKLDILILNQTERDGRYGRLTSRVRRLERMSAVVTTIGTALGGIAGWAASHLPFLKFGGGA